MDKYQAKTDAELEQLAQDIYAGKVFTTSHLTRSDDVSMVFMILGLMPTEDLKWFQKNNIQFIYEYMDRASPRSVNGLPSFFSMKYLDDNDTVRLNKRYKEIREFMEARKPKGDCEIAPAAS